MHYRSRTKVKETPPAGRRTVVWSMVCASNGPRDQGFAKFEAASRMDQSPFVASAAGCVITFTFGGIATAIIAWELNDEDEYA